MIIIIIIIIIILFIIATRYVEMMRFSKHSSKVTLIVLCMCARGMLICHILYPRHRYADASSQSMVLPGT